MPKLFSLLDYALSSLTVLIASAYLVWIDSTFSGQIFLVCWLVFLIHIMLAYKSHQSAQNSRGKLLFLLSLVLIAIAYSTQLLSIKGGSLALVSGIFISYFAALIYSFVFRYEVRDKFGALTENPKRLVLFSIVSLVLIYPYIGESLIFIFSKEMNFSFWILFLAILISNGIKCSDFFLEHAAHYSSATTPSAEEILSTRTELDLEAKLILIGLALWFIGVGAIFVVFVYN